MVKKEVVISEVEGGFIVRTSVLGPTGVEQKVYSVNKTSKAIKIAKEVLAADQTPVEETPAPAVESAAS